MNYKSQLAKENTKQNTLIIVNDINNSQKKFDEIITIFLHSEYKLVQRASNVIGIVGEKQPQLIKPYIQTFINYLNSNPIDAVKRNILRVLQFYKNLPFENAKLFNICLTYLTSNQEPIAVKAFAITICRRYCQQYPELTNEVIQTLNILLKENTSPGIQSRGKKELKILLKIN